MSRVKVAAVQFEPTMFDNEGNISRLLEVCEQAAISGARLIVTPEMGTTGYCWFDRAEVAPFVEPVPGPTTSRFAALAKQHGCPIVVGMPEVDDDRIAVAQDPAQGYPGLSGVFGPDTFEFPRREAIVESGEGLAIAVPDTSNLDSNYPTNVVRRKDLVAMRLPHNYRELIRERQAQAS